MTDPFSFGNAKVSARPFRCGPDAVRVALRFVKDRIFGMRQLVDLEFLRQKRAIGLARWLLGKYLVRRWPDGLLEARMIVEVEAYNGESDQACHARAGRTKRTEPLYQAGGIWYVYLCYGIHEMLNLVVGPEDWPAALLIRGVEGAVGPGRVTKLLQIDRRLNARSAVEPATGLWLEDRGVRVPRRLVQTTPRIGVDYAGPIWAGKHWRFHFDFRELHRHHHTDDSRGPPPRAY